MEIELSEEWEPWQYSVVNESRALCTKLNSLRSFIWNNGYTSKYASLSEREKVLMLNQLSAMEMYHNILCERIKIFEGSN